MRSFYGRSHRPASRSRHQRRDTGVRPHADCAASFVCCDGFRHRHRPNFQGFPRVVLPKTDPHVIVTAKNIYKSYGEVKALSGAGFHLPKGQRLCLIGPSGSGKSTLMRMVNALERPDSGTLTVFGREVSTFNPVLLRRKIGYVLQSAALFPHWTVADNVAIGLKIAGEKRPKRIERVQQMLELVNLPATQFDSRYPRELSGGQQQRVAIARALATNPELILFDEPFSALDPLTRKELQEEVIHLAKTLDKTILFVTHDMMEAMHMGDQIVLLRRGRVVQSGTPSDFTDRPANDFVKRFMATANVE